jgi:predicted metal-dependent hydrolase
MNTNRRAESPPLHFHMHSAIAEGIDLFNSHSFWHAHEAWEVLWLKSAGEEKIFLQGLIQLAAAYHHVQRGTFRGGVRLFDAALRKLAPFPSGYFGIDRDDVVKCAASHREKIARDEQIDGKDFPKFR